MKTEKNIKLDDKRSKCQAEKPSNHNPKVDVYEKNIKDFVDKFYDNHRKVMSKLAYE